MIDTYYDVKNPCGFCLDKQNETPGEKTQDYIQIDIDGNDTTLFIRETSVEDTSVKVAKDVEDVPAEIPTTSEVISPLTEENVQAQVKIDTITVVEEIEENEELEADDKAARNKEFDQLYFKKWSGKTYFEEELRKIRIKEYHKDVEKALKKRNLWKAFQKDLAKERRRDLIKSSGPEWWQEPSRKQICLAASLGEVITADYEEEVTGRTRQWLLDLGVTTRVNPKQVRACMKRSLLDPVDFLLEIHAVILKSELNVKKKRGDLERPFSVNERILLSAVCTLHLPTLLTILHYILPPPKPYSTEKHIQEMLFGDLDDERIRYATPYMEPLPFRNHSHFLSWAFDKVFRALLPSVIANERIEEPKRDSLSNAISSMKMSVLSQQSPTIIEKRRINSKYSDYSATGDSVTWLITQCISKRQITASLYPFYEEDDEMPKFYSRKITRKSLIKPLKQTPDIENEYYNNEELSDITSTADTTKNIKDVNKPRKKSTSQATISETKPQVGRESRNYLGDTTKNYEEKSGQLEFFDDPRVDSALKLSQGQFSTYSQLGTVLEAPPVLPLNNNMDDTSERAEGEGTSAERRETNRSEVEKLWDEIAALPSTEQLKTAIKVLRGMGDPLARLPNVHKLPTVQRWAEIRRGKNRILTKGAKTELLRRSRGMWKLAPIGGSMEGPKIKCSKREERLLTWDKKKWLESEVRKELKKYNTKVKQEKVDGARTFFPTMLNHYDHGSKLNRNFRDVFFAYLPSKEADTFTYKPWQPQEIKGS